MNTEDRLRRASQDIDRATSSLTPPPIGEVRRSARMRGIGVATATAVGAIVLVGGAVLALNPGGETTLGPAGPGETTTPTEASIPATVDGVPVDVPLPDSALEFAPIGVEVEPTYPSRAEIESDIREALDIIGRDYQGETNSVIVVGELGRRRAYSFSGAYTSRVNPNAADELTVSCLVTFSEDDHGLICGAESLQKFIENGEEGWVFRIAGTAPDGASVVSFIVDGIPTTWMRTRGSYAILELQTPVEVEVSYVVYDRLGAVLEEGPVWLKTPDSAPGATDAGTLDESCSADGMAPSVLLRSNLPQPVAVTLWDVVDAARVCDFAALATIGGDNFTASFGVGDAAEFWTQEEENGGEPMRWLLSILDLPNGVIETDNGNLYVWPAAHAHQGDWEDMPEADLEALRTLFSEEEIQGFEEFGGYYGYRVGIWENGDWSFFVAGD